MTNYRIYVKKKIKFNVEAEFLLRELKQNFNLNEVQLYKGYDIFNINKLLFSKAKKLIFADQVCDNVYEQIDLTNKQYLAVEYLPGSFDKRVDSAEQCLKLLDNKTKAKVKAFELLVFDQITQDILNKIKNYYLNPIETREKNLDKLDIDEFAKPQSVRILTNFINYQTIELKRLHKKLNLSMNFVDLEHIQKYFLNNENRNPTETEILVLDTYWSDHCRHNTFETILENIDIENNYFKPIIEQAFFKYLELRASLNSKKVMTLMDMATINAKYQLKHDQLTDLEISHENNACSIEITVDINGDKEPWLLMFKNETHNHPTEIEPFGGASTCIGGAIRDPLSGRSFVYQAMRLSGSADPWEDFAKTLEGKLPQKIISQKSADGYSSYGNQIGVATSYVKELFHPGYKAKHLEVGFVVGACPKNHVRRRQSKPGDIVIMLGGRTGRDGIGGATGSSKQQNEESLIKASSEVQKGNAPEERKIQRLFRNSKLTKLIKKANDFGAGGISVAVGELADSLLIDLDAIKTKYQGLNGTELALSESQERMAVVIRSDDLSKFLSYCQQENIEATQIAEINATGKLEMIWKGSKIVSIARNFIATNGIRKKAKVLIKAIDNKNNIFHRNSSGINLKEKFINNLQNINVSSQQNMVEMFDSTVGAGTVLMPFGGKYQLTETQISVHKIPVTTGNSKTVSAVSFGFNPYISEWSPFHGASYAIVEALAKLVAHGVDYKKVKFSFQEYFEKLTDNPVKWGKPVASLLGAVQTLAKFSLVAIGGKDSMSGSFKNLNVPPTFIAFAVACSEVNNIISAEFKVKDNFIYLIKASKNKYLEIDVEQLKQTFDFIIDKIAKKEIVSAYALGYGGIAEALAKMSFGNKIGCSVEVESGLFDIAYGDFLLETNIKLEFKKALFLGKTGGKQIVINQVNKITIDDAINANLNKFKQIYPEPFSNKVKEIKLFDENQKISNNSDKITIKYNQKVKPKVLLPVFFGMNSEYDMQKAFEKAGGQVKSLVFLNNRNVLEQSIKDLAKQIVSSQVIALSGGFSAADEPDGSGKFIVNLLNNDLIKRAIEQFLANDGLILGICNGFQALVKSGLLLNSTYESSATLFKNDVKRHVSCFVTTKVVNNQSPWLTNFSVGEVHQVAVSHGEGKFIVNDNQAQQLFTNGQIAFQYVDENGQPTLNFKENPNGSEFAIEGITSKCGRILGKMGHSERSNNQIHKNIYGNKNQDIFSNAINYFND